MFSTISNAIKTILDWLVAGTTLASVYNYDVKTYDVIPCATITPLDTEETILDTATNLDKVQFRIRVVDRNKSIEDMEVRMRILADNVLWELRKKENISLWWTVCNVEFAVQWGWLDDEQPMRTFDIICTCYTTNTII